MHMHTVHNTQCTQNTFESVILVYKCYINYNAIYTSFFWKNTKTKKQMALATMNIVRGDSIVVKITRCYRLLEWNEMEFI